MNWFHVLIVFLIGIGYTYQVISQNTNYRTVVLHKVEFIVLVGLIVIATIL